MGSECGLAMTYAMCSRVAEEHRNEVVAFMPELNCQLAFGLKDGRLAPVVLASISKASQP